jgi:hypothetical protein
VRPIYRPPIIEVLRPGCPTRREPFGVSSTVQWSPRTGLTSGRAGSRRRQVGASSSAPVVPPACHKQRSPAVCSGQSRSLRAGRWAGRSSLTWGGGGGRNCMACTGSWRHKRPRCSPCGAMTACGDGAQPDRHGMRLHRPIPRRQQVGREGLGRSVARQRILSVNPRGP